MPLPQHIAFLDAILPLLEEDPRIVGVAVGGSWLSDTMDEFSDLDLVIVVAPDAYTEVMMERLAIASSLGNLLSGFTGEHVGEPRLIICLYDDPLLHVDLKFVSLPDLAYRIEDPVILWERSDELTDILSQTEAQFPPLNPQWSEDRFWVWVHYATTKLGRGELLETLSALSFMRDLVLGPMLHDKHHQLPRGVRRLETIAPEKLPALQKTLASYDRQSCVDALFATVGLYQELREPYIAAGRVIPNTEAEKEVIAYLQEIGERAGDT